MGVPEESGLMPMHGNVVCQGQADEATTVKCRLGRTAELHYVKLLPPLGFACCADDAVAPPCGAVAHRC